jgi:hypothetical protein
MGMVGGGLVGWLGGLWLGLWGGLVRVMLMMMMILVCNERAAGGDGEMPEVSD